MSGANEFDREYIGDGLYVHRDRWGGIRISTHRDHAEHFVIFDAQTLHAFLAWIERTGGERS